MFHFYCLSSNQSSPINILYRYFDRQRSIVQIKRLVSSWPSLIPSPHVQQVHGNEHKRTAHFFLFPPQTLVGSIVKLCPTDFIPTTNPKQRIAAFSHIRTMLSRSSNKNHHTPSSILQLTYHWFYICLFVSLY